MKCSEGKTFGILFEKPSGGKVVLSRLEGSKETMQEIPGGAFMEMITGSFSMSME